MSTWIPESERDSSWAIFNQKFECSIKFIDTMSTDYIKHMGIPSVWNKKADNAMTQERVIRMYTINEMVEFFKTGVVVGIRNVADTKKIYDLITEHLQMWAKELEVGLNHMNAPIDDLIAMDQLAHAVYQHAQYHFTRETVDSLLMRRMNGMNISRNSILKPMTSNVVKNDTDDDTVPRESMADVFANFHSYSGPSLNRK